MNQSVQIAVDAQGRELRAFDARMDVDDGKLRGYATVFGQLSADLGGWRERIVRGAFARHLRDGADVRALWQHDPNYVLGRTKSGTLALVEDIHGLRVVIDPPDTQWARDAVTTIRRGDVDQMSIAFAVRTDEWTMEDGLLVRTVLDADLYDVSPVTYPAYPQTTISARRVMVREGQNGIQRLALLRRRLDVVSKL